MKANELMLADWVQEIKGGPCQVVLVDQFDIKTTFGDFWVNERRLNPLPITAAILEANGFKRNGNYYMLCYNEKDYPNHSELKFMLLFNYFEGQKMENDLWVSKVFTTVKHVHELQHALRLMGLTDLADNFKFELQ